MQKYLSRLIVRLTSRKFLVTAAGALALYSSKQYTEFVVLILGYLGVEGGADLVQRYRTGGLTALDIQEAVNPSPLGGGIVTGTGMVKPDLENKPGLEVGV